MQRARVHPKKDKAPSPGLGGRIWIDGPEGTFIGYGRVVLLERISEFGSITGAAKSMQMSYRHAWELVDSMNRQAQAPLVESGAGGKGGGGARVTEEGEKTIKLFWKLYGDFQKFLETETKKLMPDKRTSTKKEKK